MFNVAVLSTSEKLREAAKAAADEQAEQLQLMTLDIVRTDYLCALFVYFIFKPVQTVSPWAHP